MHTEVVIVGGGLAGLSAACYLARAGVAVTLFEKASSLGGRAATSNYEGYSFNRGIHAIYTGGATSEVLLDLGITYQYGIPKEVLALREGRFYPFPNGLSTLLRTNLFDVNDKLEFMRLFTTLPRLKSPGLAHVSVQEWLERTIRRPRVHQFIAATARTFVYSAALELVSAEVFIKKFQLALKHPVHYLDGGWQTLVDGLRQVAEQAGVRIVSGTRVEAILHQEGRVQGVRLRDGSSVQASAVIIATTPQEAVKLLDDGAYGPLRQLVDSLIPARLACLDVALRHLPDARHTIVQDLEHPLFISTQSQYSHIAPEGGALIYTFKQLDPLHPTDAQEDERDLEALLDITQPGWREVLVKRIYLPRIEAIGMLPTAQGGGYAGRPGPRVKGLPNLYLVGDWIGEGFLSDASMGSARQVAQLVLQDGPLATAKKAAAGSVQ